MSGLCKHISRTFGISGRGQRCDDCGWIRRDGEVSFHEDDTPPEVDHSARGAGRRITEACVALERVFDSDAYDSVYGLTPRAYDNISAVFKKFKYRLEKVK